MRRGMGILILKQGPGNDALYPASATNRRFTNKMNLEMHRRCMRWKFRFAPLLCLPQFELSIIAVTHHPTFLNARQSYLEILQSNKKGLQAHEQNSQPL